MPSDFVIHSALPNATHEYDLVAPPFLALNAHVREACPRLGARATAARASKSRTFGRHENHAGRKDFEVERRLRRSPQPRPYMSSSIVTEYRQS